MPDTPKPSRLFAFVAGRPRLILALALLFSALSVIYTKKNMEFLTGRDELMPKNAPFQMDYQVYRQEFGDQEEIVAVIESADAEKSTRAADALYQRLNRETGLFRDVFYPGGLALFPQERPAVHAAGGSATAAPYPDHGRTGAEEPGCLTLGADALHQPDRPDR